MHTKDIEFDKVTLLITHYNRSRSLQRLLDSLKMQGCKFAAIVVSDDCSSAGHLDYLKELSTSYNFKLVTTAVNGGLGNNLNKGQDAVSTPYTLYIQEDFIAAEGCAEHIKNGLSLLNEQPDLDMVRFYAYSRYPYLKPYKYGFSEMVYKWWYPGLNKFAFYSDHPHLRRSSFFKKFGRYKEGVSGDKTEFTMMMSFIRHNGKALFFDNYKSVLEQENSQAEPSTMKRNIWRNSNNFVVSAIRNIYRYINCYSGLYLRKIKL